MLKKVLSMEIIGWTCLFTVYEYNRLNWWIPSSIFPTEFEDFLIFSHFTSTVCRTLNSVYWWENIGSSANTYSYKFSNLRFLKNPLSTSGGNWGKFQIAFSLFHRHISMQEGYEIMRQSSPLELELELPIHAKLYLQIFILFFCMSRVRWNSCEELKYYQMWVEKSSERASRMLLE